MKGNVDKSKFIHTFTRTRNINIHNWRMKVHNRTMRKILMQTNMQTKVKNDLTAMCSLCDTYKKNSTNGTSNNHYERTDERIVKATKKKKSPNSIRTPYQAVCNTLNSDIKLTEPKYKFVDNINRRDRGRRAFLFSMHSVAHQLSTFLSTPVFYRIPVFARPRQLITRTIQEKSVICMNIPLNCDRKCVPMRPTPTFFYCYIHRNSTVFI